MKHFQFWHADPPPDVLGWMDAARDGLPDFEYVRFNQESGRAFVKEHYGSRAVAAWDSFALPVMYSDFLRLLFMDVYGGLYTDATYKFVGDLVAFIDTAPVAQMPWWHSLVNLNYLMVREPGNLFIRACIEMLIDNAENRRFGSTLMAVGPGVINSVRCVLSPEERPGIVTMGSNDDWLRWGWLESIEVAERLIKPSDELVAAYRSMTLVDIGDLQKVAQAQLGSSHRQKEDYWFKWKGSVYRERC